ncbi:MAG: metalloenzyme [Bacillota bacterium]
MKLLLVFLDGFGVGKKDPAANPIFLARMPAFSFLCGGEPLHAGKSCAEGQESLAISVDACLGVAGIPQSATGQTALLTGYNAPQIVGRHVNAFPTGMLRKLLASRSIFRRALECGRTATFINAFRPNSLQKIKDGTYRASATTAAVLGAGLPVRPADLIALGQAVYHDITGDILREMGVDVPRLNPRDAGRIVAKLSKDYDFAMFEFFLTDRAGHSQDLGFAVEVLERADQFIEAILESIDTKSQCLFLASDHGNIEDLSVPTHTRNPVPLVVYGLDAERRLLLTCDVRDITDVNAAMLKVVCEGVGD